MGTLAGLDARVAYDLNDTSTGTELTNTVDLETTGVSRPASSETAVVVLERRAG